MAEELNPSYNFSDDRLNELLKLFPESFEDGVFNIDILKELIGDYSTDTIVKEHFGLNWVGKMDARKIAAISPTGTLKPCLGQGVNEKTTENIFIEGENLEVLKLLRKSYSSKVKMIYIDPPYNTGNDFIYKDNFADTTEDYLKKSGEQSSEGLLVSNPRTSGKYHGNWLSFILPRIRVAKDLLTKDGVIFISIGPAELSNLILVCDEVFGEENRISICVRVAKTGGNKGKFFSPNVEYILVYAKDLIEAPEFRDEMDEALIKKVYTQTETVGERKGEKYRAMGLYQSSLDARANQRYFIKAPDGSLVIPPGDVFPEEKIQGAKIKPSSNNDGVWRWTYERYLSEFEKGNIEFKETKNQVLVDENGFPSKWNLNTKIWLNDRQDEGQLPNDLISKFENRHSSKELQDLDIPFDFAKPSELIKYLVNLANLKTGDIVLDFFAGSGTTGHAIYNYNIQYNQKVNFILVQIPEHILENSNDKYKFISDITKDRLKAAINKLEEPHKSTFGFKVYKQNTSCLYKWSDYDPTASGNSIEYKKQLELSLKNPVKDGATEDDVITEILLQKGFSLNSKVEKIENGLYKIQDPNTSFNLYITLNDKISKGNLDSLKLDDTDHFVCLDSAFESDTMKQNIDSRCKLFTI